MEMSEKSLLSENTKGNNARKCYSAVTWKSTVQSSLTPDLLSHRDYFYGVPIWILSIKCILLFSVPRTFIFCLAPFRVPVKSKDTSTSQLLSILAFTGFTSQHFEPH